MASKEEKRQRKAKVRAIIAVEQAQEEARLPLSKANIKALFDAVDAEYKKPVVTIH